MTDLPTPGVALFFLEDSAILFSEPRQELHELNTMAAVIWCHLENGKDRGGIAAELVAGLGVTPGDAANFVDQALDTWKLQGLLADRPGPTHPPPQYTRTPPDDMPDFGTPAFVTARDYRLLSIGFRLRCTTAADAALLAPIFAHLASTDTPTTSFDVVRHNEGIAIYRDGQKLSQCATTEELVPMAHNLVWLECVDLHGFFLELHAGVVGWNGKALVFPANSFGGKSTLVAEFVKRGATYYSDDFAVFDANGFVLPFARPISIRDPEHAIGVRSVKIKSMGGKVGRDPLPISLVLFTKFKERAAWKPRKLLPGEAVLRMIPHTLPIKFNPEFALLVLKRAVSRAIIIKSSRNDVKISVGKIIELVDKSVN